jgi:hypothetical protein
MKNAPLGSGARRAAPSTNNSTVESNRSAPAPQAWQRPAVRCVVCGEAIATAGVDGIPVTTAGIDGAWLHHGDCYTAFAARHQRPSEMPKERMLELFARSRAAGRLKG